ncbi:MAG: hypothetical protein J5545_05590 [Bacteroidaceae bacterium]|nr:hypothetical protein [Bacteroidaceae bacterium]
MDHHTLHNNPLSPRQRWRALLSAAVCLWIVFLWTVPAQAQEELTPTYYVNRAEEYIQANAWQAAKREIDEGLETFSSDPQLRYLNGRYYYMARQLDKARYNLTRALQEDDQHFHARRLLVDVEDDLHHYSSAICYINELLEFQPYDRDLWRRKIGLYRKIGNDVEADAALQRLARIYPNDSIVQNEVRKHNRENWGNILKRSSLAESADNLEQWLDLDPMNLSYYEELASVYERMGEYERALGVANRGLKYFPREPSLMRKVVGIMTNLGLYTQALNFVKENGGNPKTYGNLLQEVAADARMHDPYEANGRYYESTHDRDALNYLINTALTRGYDEDARMYLQDAIRRDGRTTALLMKLYGLEKRTGNEAAQVKLLNELYDKNPTDEGLSAEYAELILALGIRDMNGQQWDDARLHLGRALDLMPSEDESWPALVSRQITVLGHLGHYPEARDLYHWAANTRPDDAQRFASAYEDMAASHLRALIEEEDYEQALREAQGLLEVLPGSESALRTCINMCQTLKRQDQFYEYAQLGFDLHPESPYFKIKQAVSLQQQNRYPEALDVVWPRYQKDEWINPQLTAAYTGIAGDWALLLTKRQMPDLALQVLDSALVQDPDNKELLYTKGLACERMKDYAQAYSLQSHYNPSNAEQQEFMEHMRFLQFRGFRNRVDANYTHASYDTNADGLASTGHLYSIATVTYSHLQKYDTYTAQLSYKGIDGYHDEWDNESGGAGLELMAQWEHTFNHRWSGMVNGALSTRFFNKVGCNVSVSYAHNHDWTSSLRVGYRRTPPTYLFLGEGQQAQGEYNLFIVTPSLQKTWERITVGANVDLTTMESSLYYNVGLKGKLLINDDNLSCVSLSAGIGSFPELTFFEQTALRDLSHTNSSVGFEFQYLLTRNLILGISGTWNTCYNPYYHKDTKTYSDSYRNIYSLCAQMHIAF